MVQPAFTEDDVTAAFLCITGANLGFPHRWRYLSGVRKMYQCTVCLVMITKARLKELTDNA